MEDKENKREGPGVPARRPKGAKIAGNQNGWIIIGKHMSAWRTP